MADNTNPDIDKTQTYGDTDDIGVTKAYSSGTQSETDSPAVQSTDADKTNKTETHDLGIGDSVELNGNTYQIAEILVGDKVTGEAVIYKVTDMEGSALVLKLYYQFNNPRDEPQTEPLSRIKSFNHANVLKLHDFGTGANKFRDKFCFEISSFAAGGDLLSVPDIKNKYTIEFIEDTLLDQLLAGLRIFHDAKIYHCDLKPQNVFYSDNAQTQIVLADYGSAKTKDEESEKDIVKTTMVKGTDFYLAPEQARGVISEKNDYYSLGMILLHLLYPEYISTANLDRIIERQFAGKKIIDYSDDPDYSRLNTLIAGLTLQDINDRWGSDEVSRWLKGEDVEVTYPSTRDTVPIKLGSQTIRTETELLEFINQNRNWFHILIEDSEGYHMLLTWLTSYHDFQRKKIFDKMIQYYREDGDNYVAEAIKRYFNPKLPVTVDGEEFDLYSEAKFTDISGSIFDKIGSISRSSDIDDLKFAFFQFEFAVGQVIGIAEANLRVQIRTFLDKIALLFKIDPKSDYADLQAVLYTQLNAKNLARLLHEVDQDRKFVDHNGNELSSLEEVGIYFASNEERYKEDALKAELNAYCIKQNRKDLVDIPYHKFLTDLFSDKVKYDIEITNVQHVQAARGNLQISYKMGKSLAAFFREHSIDKAFIAHGTRIETVVVNKGSKNFISAVSAKHKIDEDAIDVAVKDRLTERMKKAGSSAGQVGRHFHEASTSNHLLNLLLYFIKSLLFLLPLYTALLIAEATFVKQESIIKLLNSLTPFTLTLDVNFTTIKGFSLYGIHFLLLLSFIPLFILNTVERVEISPSTRRIYINLGILILMAPLISMLLTYLIIVSSPVWNAAVSAFTEEPLAANPDFFAKLFYYTPWAFVILVNVISPFMLRRSFKFMPFLFSLGVYFYLSLILHDYQVIEINSASDTANDSVVTSEENIRENK